MTVSSYKELGNFGNVFQKNRRETTIKIIYLPSLIILGTLYPHIVYPLICSLAPFPTGFEKISKPIHGDHDGLIKGEAKKCCPGGRCGFKLQTQSSTSF